MTIQTTCRACGCEFQPDRTAIVRGEWRTCPACRPASAQGSDDAGGRCRECGRPLRAGNRTICLPCLTGATGL